jgi:hypothetical protein
MPRRFLATGNFPLTSRIPAQNAIHRRPPTHFYHDHVRSADKSGVIIV